VLGNRFRILSSSTPRRRVQGPVFKIGPSYELRFDPSSKLAISIESSLSLWDIESKTRILRDRPFGYPSQINWSPDGSQLCVKSTSGELVVLDARTLAVVRKLQPKKAGEGCDAVFCPESRRVLDGTWDGLLAVYDVQSGIRLQEFHFPECMLVSLVSSPSHARAAFIVKPKLSAGRGPGPQVEIHIAEWSAAEVSVTMLPRKWDLLDTVAFDSSEQLMAVIHGERPHPKAWLEIVDAASGETLRRRECVRSHNGPSAAWSPDGSTIGLVEPDGFHFYAADDLHEIGAVPLQYACHVEFSRDGLWVALGAWSRGVIQLTGDVLRAG
jgi:WD40 repeat protein